MIFYVFIQHFLKEDNGSNGTVFIFPLILSVGEIKISTQNIKTKEPWKTSTILIEIMKS